MNARFAHQRAAALGERIMANVAHGAELPAEHEGRKIPASLRDSLLEQSDNWTEVNRATGDETKGKTAKGGDE